MDTLVLVKHREEDDCVGVVLKRMNGTEVDSDIEDDPNWYRVAWLQVPEGEVHYVGHEHRSQLTPIGYVNISYKSLDLDVLVL